jgi:hypothetical protein
MLVSFRQTYGDNRKELYDIFSRDRRLLDLYNICDLNIQSFHNCSEETIDYFKERIHIERPLYLEFRNISYTETIREIKNRIKEIGARTHWIF